MRKLTLVASGLIFIASCSPTANVNQSPRADDPVETTVRLSTTLPPPTTIKAALTVIDVPAAIAVSVASNGIDDPVIAWSESKALRIARLSVSDFELGPPIAVNGSVSPIAHVIERPAISVGADNMVHVAFTSQNGANGIVFYADAIGDTPGPPVAINGDPARETNLSHLTLNEHRPVLAWLEDSTLSVAFERGGTPNEIEKVDDLTCDCCNPVPVRMETS